MSELNEAKIVIRNAYRNEVANKSKERFNKIDEITTVVVDTSIKTLSMIDENNIIRLQKDSFTFEEKKFLITHEIMHFIFTHPVNGNTGILVYENKKLDENIEICIYEVFIDKQMQAFYVNYQNLATSLGKPTGICSELGNFQIQILNPFIESKGIDKKPKNIYPLITEFLEVKRPYIPSHFWKLL